MMSKSGFVLYFKKVNKLKFVKVLEEIKDIIRTNSLNCGNICNITHFNIL